MTQEENEIKAERVESGEIVSIMRRCSDIEYEKSMKDGCWNSI